MKTSGFTLIEVLVAMAILAFITVFTAQSIQRALQNRTKIQFDIDQTGSIRDALRVMENDINQAFNYRDINISLYNETAKERNKRIEEAKANPGAPPPKPGDPPPVEGGTANPYATMEPLKPREEKILTQFIGDGESLNFTSLSNARISSEERTSDQAEIGYLLGDCKSRGDRQRSTRCLMRRTSSLIDDDVSAGGTTTALLEDVTRLEFRYMGSIEKGEWVKSWFSNERGDDRSKGVFPDAVEVTLEVQSREKKESKPVRMTLVAAVRNPNNPSKKEAPVSGAGEGQTAK